MVLGYNISKIILNAATEAFRDEYIEFERALTVMSNVDLSFWDVSD